ncbi:hypothetical protein BamIOP4010DRAFT_6905 [Burkholderia ambifaria IOP40-10]|uniref:Uncharacterized protein n=1 Tax=Burkholderia ambifaria IOP40-10 TaxID=396596 RepID=B1FS92_9BURK|nr:hypothetical protein BamIOP4010DRAFT_6905 [Burkholderia ambifaria IOP40-10]
MLSNVARSLTVPVLVSIWLSSVSSEPVSSGTVLLRLYAVTDSFLPVFTCLRIGDRLSSDVVKITLIGCICVITTIPFVSPAVT